jgi:hypothetical protein
MPVAEDDPPHDETGVTFDSLVLTASRLWRSVSGHRFRPGPKENQGEDKIIAGNLASSCGGGHPIFDPPPVLA